MSAREPAMVRLPGGALISSIAQSCCTCRRIANGNLLNSAIVTAITCSPIVSADMPRELVITIGRASSSG